MRGVATAPSAGRSPRPRNHIVPQQINVRVAIRYRTAQAIEKFGTVKRNRADQMHSWRAVTVLSLRPRMQYRDAMQALGLSETEATQFFQGR
jgi:ribosome maturation protein Sdo1